MKKPQIDLNMIANILSTVDGRLTILLAATSGNKKLSVKQLNKAINVVKGLADLCDVDPEKMMMAISELKFKKV